MKLIWLMLSVALLAASPCRADESGDVHPDCDEAQGDGHENSILDLLDPDAPTGRRAQALEGYQRASAIAHCTEYGYTLGQLYRHGPDLPGNMVPRDTAKARELLVASAEAGLMDAYASLAEMALLDGDAREAMKWTQVYLYFVKNVQKSFMDTESVRFYSAGYNGDLLMRVERAWRGAQPKLNRKVIAEDLSGYIKQHKEQVATRVRENMAESNEALVAGLDDGLRLKSVGTCPPMSLAGIGGATVVYIVEVLPSGEIGRVLPESFSPTPAVVKKLAHCARVSEFEPFDGEEPRTVRIPVAYGYERGRRAPSFKL